MINAGKKFSDIKLVIIVLLSDASSVDKNMRLLNGRSSVRIRVPNFGFLTDDHVV